MPHHPPRAPLIIHVGVTGNRTLPPTATRGIRTSIAAVYSEIEATLKAIALKEAELLPADNTQIVRLISCLAEGADFIAASAALDRGWELQSPLPFAREEYAKDFKSTSTVAEFHALLSRASCVFEHAGERRFEAAAYLEAGRTMLAQSDVLIAVWDGESSRGPGGTADIVREALAKGLPVVRIDPAHPELPVLLGAALADADWASGVRAYLNDLLALHEEKGMKRLKRYLFETERLFNWGWVHFLFRNRFSEGKWSGNGLRRSCFANATAGWDAEWRAEPALPSDLSGQIDTRLREHYAWANGLAVSYSGLFRSAYILRYFLVTVSVLFGAVGFYGPSAWGWMGFAAQVMCLLAAVGLILCDNKARWQRKAVEYRWIAEQLRIHRYLLPLGRTVLPVAQHGHPIYEGPRWGRRQVRCIVRQIGLPNALVNSAYMRAHRSFVLHNEITGANGQQSYHAKNAERNKLIASRLYRYAMWLFVLGMIAIVGRMALWDCAFAKIQPSPRWWTILKAAAATLPAFGVMFSSLRVHGEFKRLSARSKAMAEYLAVRAVAFKTNDSPTWNEAVDDTTQLALIMRAEVADWNTVMESRGLALPV